MQYTLCMDEQNQFQTQQQLQEKTKDDEFREEFPIDYCKKRIITEPYLWDMRCWEKYKDKEEVLRFLNSFNKDDYALPCGHALLCIHVVLNLHKVTPDEVAGWMLSNPHTQFFKRIVPCWKNSEKCPKYVAQGNYGNGICDGCDKQ